ncbi:MAG TPA: hypothetical protein VIF81_07040 [Pyrinomonadaceae bacterium]|jgi:hypothetical protein
MFANRRVRFAATFVFLIFAAPNVSAATCSRTSLQTDAWVERSISSLVRAAHAAYVNESAQPRYERVVNEIAGTIERCRLANNPEFSQRYPEFFGYVRLLSLGTKEDHELGFEVSDKQYFAETSQYTTIPDFLLTPAFLRSVSRFETLAAAKALLREMNRARPADSQLLFFSYASRHLGTPDNSDSYRRLLIVVPGNAAQSIPEKWVQFGIADPGRPKTVRNVSVVAVTPGDEETANVYFKDFYRTYRRNGSITIKGRWELGEGDDPCVTCHKSGVLPVFPVAGSVSNEDQSVMEAVNDRFRSYGVARFNGYIDGTKFGPGLGSSPGLANLRGVSFETNNDRFNTRSCASCHHPNGLGNLNWPMDSTLISSFVNGGQMPLDAHLSRAARRQLYDELINDYFRVSASRPGILQTWLLGQNRSDGDGVLFSKKE